LSVGQQNYLSLLMKGGLNIVSNQYSVVLRKAEYDSRKADSSGVIMAAHSNGQAIIFCPVVSYGRPA